MKMNENAEGAMVDGEKMLRVLALKAKGLSGADVELLVRQARQRARRQRRGVTYADFEAVFSSRSPQRSLDFRFRTAVHEAAHAVAKIHLQLGTISSITINDAKGGAYVQGDFQSVDGIVEGQLMSWLAVTLAGRAAEKEFCDWASTGSGGAAHSDLAAATKLAFDIETRFGFGSEWPLLYREIENCFSTLAYNRTLADHVHRRLEVAYAVAEKIVLHHVEAIKLMGSELLRHDTLEGPQLEKIVARVEALVGKPHSP